MMNYVVHQLPHSPSVLVWGFYLPNLHCLSIVNYPDNFPCGRKPEHLTTDENTIQKSISIVFCVSAIRHDSSLSKCRKQKQSPP